MKKMTTAMLAVACMSLSHTYAQSIGPSIVNAAGGSGSIGSNRFDWSIGEMTMVSTFTGSSIIVTQGVLQNNKGGAGVASQHLLNDLQVFPNPASSVVNLRFTTESAGTLSYRLMDITGRMIMKRSKDVKQGATQEELNITDLAAATYMLEVTYTTAGGNEEAASYKIEKLK